MAPSGPPRDRGSAEWAVPATAATSGSNRWKNTPVRSRCGSTWTRSCRRIISVDARTMALILDLRAAIREFVHDGEIVAQEGFTHLIPSAAGHEIVRQRPRSLSFSRRGNNVLSTNTRVRDENTD